MASNSYSISVFNEVISHLSETYGLNLTTAQQVYSDAMQLYHRLFTITDLNQLQSVNRRVLSSLIVIIRENFELNDSFKYYMSVVFHIVFAFNLPCCQWIFMDWFAYKIQDVNVNNGLQFLLFMLNQLQKHFDADAQLSDSNKWMIRSILLNIQDIQIAITDKETKDTIEKVEQTLRSYVNDQNMCMSDDSDMSNEQDDDRH